MDDDAYWSLVEHARAEAGDDSPGTVAESLVAQVVRLRPAEVVEGDRTY